MSYNNKEVIQMPNLKLLLDSSKVYHKEFVGTKPGYDAMQVDSFLDIVIKDYESFETYQQDCEKEISQLNQKLDVLNKQLSEVEIENVKLKNKVSGIASNTEASLNNVELLKRIDKLEKALSRAGINPNTIE